MSTLQSINLKHPSSASNNVVLDNSGNTTISGNATISGSATVGGVAVVTTTGTQTLTNKTLTSPTISGTPVMGASVLTLDVAKAATGANVDFTGIPSWVRRITVMFNGVSTNGTSAYIVQLGTSSGFVSTGYISRAYAVTTNSGTSTAGFMVVDGVGFTAAAVVYGHAVITNVSGNVFVYSSLLMDTGTPNTFRGGGGVTLGGALDRVRITTVNGTDAFDAGTINIIYE